MMAFTHQKRSAYALPTGVEFSFILNWKFQIEYFYIDFCSALHNPNTIFHHYFYAEWANSQFECFYFCIKNHRCVQMGKKATR